MTHGPEPFEIEGAGGPIRGDLFLAAQPKGTVVICHGFKGFARWGFFPHLAREISAASLNAIAFDFSGNGVGPDRESFTEEQRFTDNTFGAELEDIGRVVAHARSRKLIGKAFGLFGHSRGGATAVLHAGSDPDVAALVTWSAISYLRRWGATEATEWRRSGYREVTNSRTGQVLKMGPALLDEVESHAEGKLDVEAAAARIRVPWLIVHGIADETVPPAEAARLHAASSAHSTLRIMDGSHAFDATHPLAEVPPALEAATTQTVSFFVRQLAEA